MKHTSALLPAKDETHSHVHMKHTSYVLSAKACFRLRVEQYANRVCSITRVKDLLVGRGLSVKVIGLQLLHVATRSRNFIVDNLKISQRPKLSFYNHNIEETLSLAI